jgi:hypothetical protein
MIIKKASTFFCVLVLAFCATQVVFADVEVGSGYYYAMNDDLYRYKWMVDENGNRYTDWTINGKGQIPYAVHVVPGPGTLGKTSTNADVSVEPTLNIDIHSVGDKILSICTDENVNCDVIELSSGKIIKQFNIDGNVNIDLSDLDNNKAYGIVSANSAGKTHCKTFILNNNELLIGR